MAKWNQTDLHTWELVLGREEKETYVVSLAVREGEDGSWMMVCYPVYRRGKPLEARNLDDAKREALWKAEEALRKAHNVVLAQLDAEDR